MNGEAGIVFRGASRKGRTFIIRYPKISDVSAMHRYINELSQERTFIGYQGEEVPLEDEANYLKGQLEKIRDHTSVLLLSFVDDVLVGISEIDMQKRIDRHIGIFRISLAKEYRDEGIGSRFMDIVIAEAVRLIPSLEIVTLTIFATNEKAKKMYEKKGFIQYGSLPNGIKLEHGYTDHEFMYKVVRSPSN